MGLWITNYKGYEHRGTIYVGLARGEYYVKRVMRMNVIKYAVSFHYPLFQNENETSNDKIFGWDSLNVDIDTLINIDADMFKIGYSRLKELYNETIDII